MEEDQKKLQQLSESLQKLQDDLQTSVSTRQTLTSQQNESLAVEKEFKSSSSDSQSPRIFRLLGPVLLSQSHSEAQTTVSSRLKYISQQLADTDTRIKDLQSQSNKVQGDLMGLQQKMQQQMAAQQQHQG